MSTRSQSDDIYKIFKAIHCQPRILYPAKISLNEEEMKTFPRTQRLTELMARRPVLQEMLKKRVLQDEMKGQQQQEQQQK